MISNLFKKIYTYTAVLFILISNVVSAETPPIERVVPKKTVKTATSNLDEKNLGQLVADVILVLSKYVTTILLGLIVLVFLWGLMKYMYKGQGSDTARAEGRKLMLWGVIGIFVVTSWIALVTILASFVGHKDVIIPQF